MADDDDSDDSDNDSHDGEDENDSEREGAGRRRSMIGRAVGAMAILPLSEISFEVRLWAPSMLPDLFRSHLL